MRTVVVTCRGLSPLLMDRMTEETLEGLRTGVRVSKPKDRPKTEVAREKLCRETYKDDNGTPDGPIGIPSEMLFSCLVAAGRNVKHGKKQVSTAKTTTLPDFMTINSFFMPLTNIDGEPEDSYWVPDSRRGRLQDGTAVCIVRPKFKEWTFDAEIEYDEKIVDESVLRALFRNAGSAQGLGSFRPNCKGQFGRFVVANWKQIGGPERAPANASTTLENGKGSDANGSAKKKRRAALVASAVLVAGCLILAL